MTQLHKKFTDKQVKELLKKYDKYGIERKYIEDILGIKTRQFWKLIKKYREDAKKFTIEAKKKGVPNKISKEIEGFIRKQLKIEKEIIEDKRTPVRKYNYSYVRDIIKEEYGKEVSVPTIIKRAKEQGYCITKKLEKKAMTELY